MAEGEALVQFPVEPASSPPLQPVNPAGQQGQDQVEKPAQPQELEVTIQDLLFAFITSSQRGPCIIGFFVL